MIINYLAGPCGGKTTGQARLCTFFENLGWKVNELSAGKVLSVNQKFFLRRPGLSRSRNGNGSVEVSDESISSKPLKAECNDNEGLPRNLSIN